MIHHVVKAARKAYTCDWCGERIDKGEAYARWYDYGESTCRVHPECLVAIGKADLDEELPPRGTYGRGCWCGGLVIPCRCGKEGAK